MNNTIQVFEYTTLPVGSQLTFAHFDRLVEYNERHGNLFFAVGSKRIYFRNYVGVIQVGNLTIEILPKADKGPDSSDQKRKWQGALIDMLRQSGFIRLTTMSDARLRLRSSSLLDIFFESFLAEVSELMHQGLVRKYRQTCGNLPVLKGRVLFQRHLVKNIVHRERFFTAYEFYDRNNPFNQILLTALNVLIQISLNPNLVALARNLASLFGDVEQVIVAEETFARLLYTRNTERYRRALQLARLIILNYSPDLRGGRENVLGILFDMNRLFEQFIYARLKRAEARQKHHRVSFKAQMSRQFWSAKGIRKSIRPDIIAQITSGSDQERVVMDTKWKIPVEGKPLDADLKQMHTYNVQFGARRSFLIYPRVSNEAFVKGRFVHGEALPASFDHTCGMVFLKLFDGDKLRHDVGQELIEMLTVPEPID